MMIIVDDVGTQGTRYPFQGPRELRQLMDVLFFFGQFGTHCIALLDIPISPFWMMTFL
jgi:hypothetical protein